MRKIITTIVMALLLILPMNAEAFDTGGVSSNTSFSDNNTIGASGDCHKFKWSSFGIFGRNYQTPTWYIDYELDVGYMKWDIAGSRVETTTEIVDGIPVTTTKYYQLGNSSSTLSLEGKMMFNKKVSIFDLGIGGGLALLYDSGNVVHLSPHSLYGLITARVRLPINRDLGLDFEADHISAIGKHDRGMNVWKFGAYLMF